jgi:hypothetical protein
MSADTEVANILTHATNAASSMAGTSSSLVAAAVAALESPIEFPGYLVGEPQDQEEFISGLFPPRDEPPTSFPAWPEVNFPPFPNIQTPSEVEARLDVASPSLSLPTFVYGAIQPVGSFNTSDPDMNATVSVPPDPDTSILYTMQLQRLQALLRPEAVRIREPYMPPLNVRVPPVSPNLYDEAYQQYADAIAADVDPILAESAAWCERILAGVLPYAIEALNARFSASTAPVLGAAAHQALIDRLQQRLDEERARVEAVAATDRSGWDLPVVVREAMANAVRQIRQTEFHATQAGFYTKSIELAVAIFEVYGDLVVKFSTGIGDLYSKAIKLTIDAHQASLAAAKQTISALLKMHELLYVVLQDLDLELYSSKLDELEARLAIAMVPFETAKLTLELERAKQENDEALIKTLQANVDKAKADVDVHAAEMTALKARLEAAKLPVDLFGLKVRAFEARVKAMQAAVECRVAMIDGDVAALEGQLTKVKAFEAQAAAFEKEVAAKVALVEAQSQRNTAVIAEFDARVKGELAPIQQQVLKNTYELQKYEVIANDVLANAKLADRASRLQLDFQKATMSGRQEAYRYTMDRAIKLMEAELDRASAIAETNDSGAKIMAAMAQSAMTSANAVAHTIITESE